MNSEFYVAKPLMCPNKYFKTEKDSFVFTETVESMILSKFFKRS